MRAAGVENFFYFSMTRYDSDTIALERKKKKMVDSKTRVSLRFHATRKKKEESQTINERVKDEKVSTPRHLVAISKENKRNDRKKLLLRFLGDELEILFSLNTIKNESPPIFLCRYRPYHAQRTFVVRMNYSYLIRSLSLSLSLQISLAQRSRTCALVL